MKKLFTLGRVSIVLTILGVGGSILATFQHFNNRLTPKTVSTVAMSQSTCPLATDQLKIITLTSTVHVLHCRSKDRVTTKQEVWRLLDNDQKPYLTIQTRREGEGYIFTSTKNVKIKVTYKLGITGDLVLIANEAKVLKNITSYEFLHIY